MLILSPEKQILLMCDAMKSDRRERQQGGETGEGERSSLLNIYGSLEKSNLERK